MIQESVVGKITDINETGVASIKAIVPDMNRAVLRKYSTVHIIFDDGRRISCTQRRKCYALLGEIAEYTDGIRTAETVDEQKRLLKMEFMLKRMEATERRMFSLSDCDMSTAREFITYLIDFIIANDIPTRVPLIDNCDDIAAYMYACTMHRKCAVCGSHKRASARARGPAALPGASHGAARHAGVGVREEVPLASRQAR